MEKFNFFLGFELLFWGFWPFFGGFYSFIGDFLSFFGDKHSFLWTLFFSHFHYINCVFDEYKHFNILTLSDVTVNYCVFWVFSYIMEIDDH